METSRLFSSVRWVFIAQAATRIVGVATSIGLARLLAPEDFGLLSMSSVIAALGTLIGNFGAGAAIVQRREVSEPLLRSLFTIVVAVGVGITVVVVLLSGPLSAFYGEPRVRWVIAAVGSTFAIAPLGLVSEALLQRELRFSRIAAIDTMCLTTNSLMAIALAVLGFGVWSLVAANLAGIVLRTAGLLASARWRPRLGIDLNALRDVLGFSGSIFVSNVAQYLARNSDRLIIGRTLGASPLGYYDYAYRLYTFPMELISNVLLAVMFPTFARLQDDKEMLGKTFLRTNGAIALVGFPLLAGLGAVADPFVRVVLSEKWIQIVPLMLLLCPAGILQTISVIPGQVMLAQGRAGLRMLWTLVYTAVIVTAFFVGVRWGVTGVAACYGAVMVPINLAALGIALHLLDLRGADLWRVLKAPAIATGLMVLAVLAADAIVRSIGGTDLVRLAAGVVIGALSYASVVRVLSPEGLADLQRFLPDFAANLRLVRWFTRAREASR